MGKKLNSGKSFTKTNISTFYLISGLLAGIILGFLAGLIYLFILPPSSNELLSNLPPYLAPLTLGGLTGLIIVAFEKRKQPLSKYTNLKAGLRLGLIRGAEFGSFWGLFLVDIFLEMLNISGTLSLFITVVISLIIGSVVGGFLGALWGIIWVTLLQLTIKMKILPSNFDGNTSNHVM